MTFSLPHAQALLDQWTALATGPLPGLPIEISRASFVAMVGMTERPAAAVSWQVAMRADVPVRIYTPSNPRPGTFVFFHGGSFMMGSAATHHSLAAEIAQFLSACVVSVDYRLAPEHPFPAAYDDCCAVVTALAAMPPEARGPLWVGGDSAGGTLATAVALRLPHHVAGQCLFYPATDLSGRAQQDNASRLLGEGPGINWPPGVVSSFRETKDHRLAPLYADLSTAPPCLIVTCGLDPLQAQGLAYAEALRQADRRVLHRAFAHLPHGCFTMRAAVPQAQEALHQALGDFQTMTRS